jgi:hypothetical protein
MALDDLGARRSPAAELLPWLAGPYRAVPRYAGWLAVEPRQLATRTRACLEADGGVRRLADVQAEFADLEIEARQLIHWLRASGATVIHDLTVLLAGPVPDAVERVLDAHGLPRTPQEIAADLADAGRTIPPGALDAALHHRRFARAKNGAIGLSAWPPERRPTNSKRQTNRKPKARKLAAAEPKAAQSDSPERLWLWVRVDDDVLRGADAAVPIALVQDLGLAPLSRRTFASRWGPVTLAYDGPQPARGSVRAVALAAGARTDDTLLLGFSRTSPDVAVEVRRGSVPTADADATGTGLTLFPEIASGGTH